MPGMLATHEQPGPWVSNRATSRWMTGSPRTAAFRTVSNVPPVCCSGFHTASRTPARSSMKFRRPSLRANSHRMSKLGPYTVRVAH
jgi:hypothetical protein